ncbi:hypothetical protein GCM10007063_11500 [Lentibacillus kapialis]|uniref:Uncharacterized protein n=1 Tax=Lentibacillus kapialis TaxID=340214 RepID=A0A917PT70_9BACI|nr:hypothetical protein GCM10007063_11500 [Lentibacillus kapialis]
MFNKEDKKDQEVRGGAVSSNGMYAFKYMSTSNAVLNPLRTQEKCFSFPRSGETSQRRNSKYHVYRTF